MPQPDQRRLTGAALTVAVHLALIYGWHLARTAPPPDADAPANAIAWLKLAPPAPVKVQPPPPKPAPPPPEPRSKQPRAGAPAQAPAAAAIPPPPVPDAPPARSAADMLEQARRDVGKIARDLRKEYPGPHIAAPPNTPLTRMARGMEEAADLAPNKWYEAPKVTEVIDPGGYGRRRYRVVTAGGTYCVTYESNHAPDGLDTMKNGIKPKLTTCDKDEQAATKQQW